MIIVEYQESMVTLLYWLSNRLFLLLILSVTFLNLCLGVLSHLINFLLYEYEKEIFRRELEELASRRSMPVLEMCLL